MGTAFPHIRSVSLAEIRCLGLCGRALFFAPLQDLLSQTFRFAEQLLLRVSCLRHSLYRKSAERKTPSLMLTKQIKKDRHKIPILFNLPRMRFERGYWKRCHNLFFIFNENMVTVNCYPMTFFAKIIFIVRFTYITFFCIFYCLVIFMSIFKFSWVTGSSNQIILP